MRYNFIDVSDKHMYHPSYLPEDGGSISQNDVLYSHSRKLKISRVLWRVSLAIKFSDYDGWKWAQMPVQHFPTTRTAVNSSLRYALVFPPGFSTDLECLILKTHPAHCSHILIPFVSMSVLRWNMPLLTVTPNLKTSTAGNIWKALLNFSQMSLSRKPVAWWSIIWASAIKWIKKIQF